MHILVLDVGTSSMRGTVLNDAAAVLFCGQIKYQPSFLDNGRVEQDAADWVAAMETLCRQAAEETSVDAVAITAQRSSVIAVDRTGQALMPAIMWQDGRTQALCRGLEDRNEQIRNRCGSDVNTVFSASKMGWIEQNCPEIMEHTAHFCVIPDFLILQLTGRYVTDDTYASRSLLMNLKQRTWDDTLLALFGVNRDRLNPIVPVGSVVGTVTADYAACTGLPAGIPVVTCGGDQQCAALGQGVLAPGDASINLGTGAYLVSVVSAPPKQLERGMTCNTYAIPGQFMLESSVLTCGAALDWALNTLYDGATPEQAEQALEKTEPGAGGVLALPYFQGRSSIDWNASARATFYGVSLSTGRDDLLRALLEGICCELRRHLERMERVQPVERMFLSGGLTRSQAFCQLLADVCQKPVVCGAGTDATTCGAWISAAVTLGIYPDYISPARLVAGHTRIALEPNAALSELYCALTRQGDALYRRLYGKEESKDAGTAETGSL